jgi:SNF2 family DNA or RNA helicase
LPNEVKRMIAAGDISSAVSYLGGQRENKKLSDIIIEKEEYSLRQLEASLIYYAQLENTNKVDEIKEKIEKAKSSLENLKNKIQEIENEECPVCYDDFNNQKILTNCCKFILCNNCIKNIVLTTNKCPFCRTQIDMKSLIVSTTDSIKESDEKKPVTTRKSKLDTVIEIINSKPDGKFLLFSEYWQTFSPISEVLTTNNISWAEIKGTTDTKQKNIKLFKEGKIKVLFLNARHDGTGINLPETTDIILYHKVSSDSLETQIFGRALRLGRTSALHVHRLLAEGENFIQNSSSARLNLINHSDDLQVSENNNTSLSASPRNSIEEEDESDIEIELESELEIDMNNVTELEDPSREVSDSREIEINNIMLELNRSEFSSINELREYATAIYISRYQT